MAICALNDGRAYSVSRRGLLGTRCDRDRSCLPEPDGFHRDATAGVTDAPAHRYASGFYRFAVTSPAGHRR